MKADIVSGRLILTPESLTEENALAEWKGSALKEGYFNMDRNQKVYQIGENSIECQKLSDCRQSQQSAKYAAFVEEVREARRLWMDMYPPEDGHDCVTPFDQFLYVYRCPSHESEQGVVYEK